MTWTLYYLFVYLFINISYIIILIYSGLILLNLTLKCLIYSFYGEVEKKVTGKVKKKLRKVTDYLDYYYNFIHYKWCADKSPSGQKPHGH